MKRWSTSSVTEELLVKTQDTTTHLLKLLNQQYQIKSNPDSCIKCRQECWWESRIEWPLWETVSNFPQS